MKKKAIEITTLDWLNHFSRTAANLVNREAVTASNKALSVERVAMVTEYGKNHAQLTTDLSLSMAVFTGTKAAKQSLKRSLGLAMVKASNETYSLHFAGDNCTVIGYTARIGKDKLQEAWDTLGESVPAHVIEQMQTIHQKAAVALREATKELREKADSIAQEEKVERATTMLKVAGQKVTEEAVKVLVACMG
jgi:hypothetical protein